MKLTINPLRAVRAGARTYTGQHIDAATAASWKALTERISRTTNPMLKRALQARRRNLLHAAR